MTTRCSACEAGRTTGRHTPTTEQPTLETLEEWAISDGGCEATDGCWTESDGQCEHGHDSWMLVLGLI